MEFDLIDSSHNEYAFSFSIDVLRVWFFFLGEMGNVGSLGCSLSIIRVLIPHLCILLYGSFLAS